MSKLIEKRIASATSKLTSAFPSLKFKLTDDGAAAGDIAVVVKHGRTAIVDTTVDRSFGVRELVSEVDGMIGRALGVRPVTPADDQDDATAQGRAAEDPEPLLADTPPADDVVDAEIREDDEGIVEPDGELDFKVDQDFIDHIHANADKAIAQAIQSSNRGALVMNIDVAVRFVDLQTAHVIIFGGEGLSVTALSELGIHAIAEKVGDFISWGYLNSWREPGKHAVTVQMRRLS